LSKAALDQVGVLWVSQAVSAAKAVKTPRVAALGRAAVARRQAALPVVGRTQAAQANPAAHRCNRSLRVLTTQGARLAPYP
jgi:hypothetical protein